VTQSHERTLYRPWQGGGGSRLRERRELAERKEGAGREEGGSWLRGRRGLEDDCYTVFKVFTIMRKSCKITAL